MAKRVKKDAPLRIDMEFEDALRHILKAKPAPKPRKPIARKGAKKR